MSRILIVYIVFNGEYVHSKNKQTPCTFALERMFRGIKEIRNRVCNLHSKRNEGRIETVEWSNFSTVRSASSRTQESDKGLLIREAGSNL